MLFWIVAAALTAGVLLMIVPPLIKTRGAVGPRGAYDLEVYRDQLAELDHDLARGLISAAQADAAKAEIGRRMLAAAGEAKAEAPAAPRRTRVLAVLVAVLLPLGTLAVYLPLGRPDEPARPLASRDLERERGGPPQQVLAALDKLKEHLAATPDDVDGWVLMGRAYARMGNAPEAADAFRRASALRPDDASLASSYGEMLVESNDGMVTTEATKAFEAALAIDPKEPGARFYHALGRAQAGDTEGALAGWRALAAETPADAPWLPAVQAQIRQAAERLGKDAAALMPQPLPPAAPPAAAAPGAPGGMAGAGTGGTDEQQRDTMIRGMVDGLAARLKDDPSDVDGWLRLARSYTVLGESAKAVEAARSAVERAPRRPDALMALADALVAGAPKDRTDAPLPDEAAKALRGVLELEPGNREALWLLGLDAANTGRRDEAERLWTRLLSDLDPKDPDHAFLSQRIAQLKGG